MNITSYIIYSVIIYIFGYIFTLIILKRWGKKIGLDYSEGNWEYDDPWKNNTDAYTFFCAIWPVFWVLNCLYTIWWLLTNIWNNTFGLLWGGLKKLTDWCLK